LDAGSPSGLSMRIIGIVALSAALGGCASSTGIVPAGPDTYTISERFAPVRGGGEAQRDALSSKEGSLYLTSWGKLEIQRTRMALLAMQLPSNACFRMIPPLQNIKCSRLRMS
jgi:hypothetical protein